jgi:hypothetical protein
MSNNLRIKHRATEANENILYCELNSKDTDRLSQGLGIEAKNPAGTWKLDEHLVGYKKLRYIKIYQ